MRIGVPLTSLALLGAALWLAAAPAHAAKKSKAKAHGPARGALSHQAGQYWDQIAAKRRIRIAKRRSNEPITLDDYVLTQPPKIWRRLPPRPPSETHIPRVPVLADFLRAAAQQHGFVPDAPESETAFKRAYARVALSAGLTREQAVGIYSFETGGNGTYNVQSGLTHPGPRARAISPAIGYNQLLSTNSGRAPGGAWRAFRCAVAGQGRGALRRCPRRDGAKDRNAQAHDRILPLRAVRMGRARQARQGHMGRRRHPRHRGGPRSRPLLQTQKLFDSVAFVRSKGHEATLTASELALMNLTGDGNGLDLVTMPKEMRAQVPTSNFFQEGGYNRNSIARQTAVVSVLFEAIERKMNRAAQQPGAQDLAAAFDEAANASRDASATPTR